MNTFVNLSQLNKEQIVQYTNAIQDAFPEIIGESEVIKRNWSKLEKYFPQFQILLLSEEAELIGFMNVIPFQYKEALEDLPEEGWDWMFLKGIDDYENQRGPNYLGGLQVIVRKKYQKQGYSKKIIDHCNSLMKLSELSKLLIPIRPTKKHLYPRMSMNEYMIKKDQGKIFDPWIRTHVKGGAKIIKSCERSMTMVGDIKFWERILNRNITASGEYILEGALSPIRIDITKNTGSYLEPNIWIKYEC